MAQIHDIASALARDYINNEPKKSPALFAARYDEVYFEILYALNECNKKRHKPLNLSPNILRDQ